MRSRSRRRERAYARRGGRREWVASVLAQRPSCEARVLCQGQRTVDVHERWTRGRGGPFNPTTDHDFNWWQFVPLCRPCHDWVTANPTTAELQGLIVSEWGAWQRFPRLWRGGKFIGGGYD